MAVFNPFSKTGFANAIDNLGTKIGLPEWQISEKLNNNKPTAFTGYTDKSQKVYGPIGSISYNKAFSPQGPSVQSATTTRTTTPNTNTSSSIPTYSTPTNTGGDGGGSGDPLQGSTDQYRQQQEGLINDQFGGYFNYLDQQMGLLPEHQKNYEDQIANLYGSQQSTINTGKDASINQLHGQEGKVVANKVSNLKDLEENMRNQIYAGHNMLGARGAGDSSAAGMYSYALAKQGDKSRAGVNKQASGLLAEIGTRMNDVVNTTNDQLQQLGTWKNNQMLQVSQEIEGEKQRLQGMVAQGLMDKGTALRELNTNIYQTAYARLADLDKRANDFKNSLTKWALERSSALDNYKMQLGQLSGYSAPELAQQELNGAINYQPNVGSSDPSLTGLNVNKKPGDEAYQYQI